jgi:hypothetical protein
MRIDIITLFCLLSLTCFSQNNECKLNIGTNLSGISDWMTEMPFVDMMHNARTWGTRNRSWVGGNAQNHWNTEFAHLIEKDENGYPLELPFYDDELALEDSQMVFTVWAIIDAWEPGIYTFLYDGEGDFDFRADGRIVKHEQGRAEVEIIPSAHSFLELVITRSAKGNHLRNFRLIMPGHEHSYIEQAFNPIYLERLADFAALRFMDWGSTNNWGENNAWDNYDEPSDTVLVPWSERSKMAYYTWAHNKGAPYEMMCKLANALQKDMWVCVPHNASDEYIREMAGLVKSQLDPQLKVYAEYSNEIWNWMFGQTQWLNKFFCVERNVDWPEGIVSQVQRNLDLWNQVFSDQRERLILVAGGQTGWQDVTNRIVNNLSQGSFDALNITGYFGLSSEGDQFLDELGAEATVSDIAYWARKNMYEEEITYIANQYRLAQELDLPLVFYEAGQHLTPHPFGEEPAYAGALLDLHRDTAMYNLYIEWFNLIESVLNEGDKSLYMNFSFVSARSARYGSWGILETLNQDTSAVYAPKYQAIIDKIYQCNNTSNNIPIWQNISEADIRIKQQQGNLFTIESKLPFNGINIYNANGQCVKKLSCDNETHYIFQIDESGSGLFLFEVKGENFHNIHKVIVSSY